MVQVSELLLPTLLRALTMRFGTNQNCKFSRDDEHVVRYAINWLEQHGPKLVHTNQGEPFVDTMFSRLLGRSSIMVGGMTPFTVSWDFVASTLNTGCHKI